MSLYQRSFGFKHFSQISFLFTFIIGALQQPDRPHSLAALYPGWPVRCKSPFPPGLFRSSHQSDLFIVAIIPPLPFGGFFPCFDNFLVLPYFNPRFDKTNNIVYQCKKD
jgi:hypothetical protein